MLDIVRYMYVLYISLIFQVYHVVVTAVTSEGNISVSSNNITILPENKQTNGVVVKDGLPCDKQGNPLS